MSVFGDEVDKRIRERMKAEGVDMVSGARECRVMPTRTCPEPSGCGNKPCERFWGPK